MSQVVMSWTVIERTLGFLGGHLMGSYLALDGHSALLSHIAQRSRTKPEGGSGLLGAALAAGSPVVIRAWLSAVMRRVLLHLP